MSRTTLISLLAALTVAPLASAAEPRALYDAGKYEEAVGAVLGQGDPSRPDLYVAGDSLAKLDRRDEARDVFNRLVGGDDDPWTFIARSAVATLEGNFDAALDAATQAVALAPDDFHAHYQLGLVQSLRGDFDAAAQSLERATQIDGDHAYAHYYAAIAYNKGRRMDRMDRHFQAFVSLAPNAPERTQVQMILRTLR
jgi:tetratricopeptide (TPR) repeat protein